MKANTKKLQVDDAANKIIIVPNLIIVFHTLLAEK